MELSFDLIDDLIPRFRQQFDTGSRWTYIRIGYHLSITQAKCTGHTM